MPRRIKSKPTRPATLADVGQAAGVSAMAVSAALNDARTSSRISPATRERILKAAAELQYRPNAAARGLADRRMHTIGVAAVIDGGAAGELDQYFLTIFNGVIEAAALKDQNATVLALHNWEKDLSRLVGFCDGRVDGIILIAPVISPGTPISLPPHTPFVSIHSNTMLSGVTNLESDEENGAYQITSYLTEKGHRRILHISGESHLIGSQRRVQGYRRALMNAGVAFDANLLCEGSFSQPGASAALRQWLSEHKGEPLPDAIFAANDRGAIAALEIFAEMGIRVPQDISVAGFDDIVAARTTVPQLTTVRQPLRSMGRRAVDALLDRIEHQHDRGLPEAPSSLIFATEVVHRSSVAAPAKSTAKIPELPAIKLGSTL